MMTVGDKASKDGLHIVPAGKRVDNFVVYHLMDEDVFICAAYGPAAVKTLGLLADRLSREEPSFATNGLEWLLLQEN